VAARDHSLRRRLSHHLLAEVVPNQAVTVVLSQVDIEKSGIRDELTAEAQAAIDEFESEFREMVLEDARYLDDDDDDDDDGDPS
ncbi:hypothetical protein, partial [Mycobacterium kiyosense]|uniref:hypothetical protein n=1 Tax=Mycobacterium kiyosense TaxID=2871094 RepID=UPI00222FA42F